MNKICYYQEGKINNPRAKKNGEAHEIMNVACRANQAKIPHTPAHPKWSFHPAPLPLPPHPSSSFSFLGIPLREHYILPRIPTNKTISKYLTTCQFGQLHIRLYFNHTHSF